MRGAVLANRSTNRRALDYYPTPPDVVHALLAFLPMRPGYVVWEPACGTGNIARVVESYDVPVIATDVRHTGFGQGGVDFLTTEPRPCSAIITNPPFNLSAQFIERACGIAPIVAMLLKSQYWHAAKRLTLFTRLQPTYVLPLTWRPDFLAGTGGGAPTMEVLWTVWIGACNTQTLYQPLAKPKS